MSDPATAVRGSFTRRGLRILWVAICQQKAIFAISLAGSVVYGALTVADGLALGWATDHVIAPAFAERRTTFGAIAVVIALFFGIGAVRAAGVVARRLGAGVMQYRLQADYRRQVTRAYQRLPISWHAQHPTGRLLSNANADVEATWRPIAPMPMAVGVIAMLVFGVAAMFHADWVLALIGCAVFPLVFVSNLAFQRQMSPLAAHAQQLRAEVSEVAHESFDGALVVKTMGREDIETERFAVPTDELRDANIAVMRIRAMFDPLIEVLPRFGVLVVLVIGALRVQSGAIEAGAVVQVAFLFTLLGFPIRALGWVLAELPLSVVGWDRVQRVLTAPGETSYGSRGLPPGGLELRLDGVRFGYQQDRPVLREVTFDVPAGRTVALVGPTAAGKSTLGMLITRLVDPDGGRIRLGGVDLAELAEPELPSVVAMVGQSTFLFDDTVRVNVTLGADLDDAQVWQALQTAQADGFVRALPLGLDTHVGERGTTLSGGQRQRIALARAVVRRPRLLVLDDATSAVDPQVEARILSALRTHQSDSTTTSSSSTTTTTTTSSSSSSSSTTTIQPADGGSVLVIAYRKATIALADEVAFLDGGRVVDRGTDAELVARNRAYRELIDAYEIEHEITHDARPAP